MKFSLVFLAAILLTGCDNPQRPFYSDGLYDLYGMEIYGPISESRDVDYRIKKNTYGDNRVSYSIEQYKVKGKDGVVVMISGIPTIEEAKETRNFYRKGIVVKQEAVE